MENNESNARTLVGKIVSDAMQKTVVVVVERTFKHQRYGKMITRQTKLHAHDEDGIGKVGNTVKIQETRPISKMKKWKLLEIVS